MKAAFLILLFTPFGASESAPAKDLPANLTEHTLKMRVGAKAATAELPQFTFLQGAWSGTGFGAKCDEMWTAPSGNCMLGTFRMVDEDQLQFTEFCVIQKTPSGGIELRLKHFDAEFKGWEVRDRHITFPLIKVEEKAAYFGGLTYEVQDDGSLRIWVAIKNKDGGYKEEGFHLQPVK